MVDIEIDGKKLEVPQGQMIIEAADAAQIAIPRFCYHKKLTVVANCRMCLVDVANAPKPLPACATPVSQGMKISTVSARARQAQKAVMEFLLINHPLDCPVCDQGGQCELQDVALEYGQDYSQFDERKRVVKDKNIGPLIATEMTRCIHCTRCVRFGSEVAGVRELGATGRGEFMEIGTFIEKSVNSEVSGNVIDLCPVGALTSKPFRFRARAWEMRSQPSISPHDCVGSNLFFHTLRDKVMRALPRENESLNEVWLSDRDRFSYEAFNHPDRLTQPWIKRDNRWEPVDWVSALNFAVEKLQKIKANEGPEQIGALLSPNSTLEEFYLAQKLLRAQGCHNIDHRLRQVDDLHRAYMGAPQLGISLSALEKQEKILLIGSDIHKEQPLIGLRLRKATLHGGEVFAINPWQVGFNFAIKQQLVGPQGDLILPLMQLVKALLEQDKESTLSTSLKEKFSAVDLTEEATQLAHALRQGKQISIILGAYAWSHPQASTLYALSKIAAELLQATWGEMSEGANSAGGYLAGALPQFLPMGVKNPQPGLKAATMWEQKLQAYVLLNCEPQWDCATPHLATQALSQAQAVIVLSAFDDPRFREYADVILPVTPVSEMAGTYVNAFGEWQSFQAAVNPLGESRPAWKVLRVLANFWQTPDFGYETIEEVQAQIKSHQPDKMLFSDQLLSMPLSLPLKAVSENKAPHLIRLAPTPLYAVDAITRRSSALQQTEDALMAAQVRIHPEQVQKQHLKAGQKVWVAQQGMRSHKPLSIMVDERIPLGAALVSAGIEETQSLGAAFELIELVPLNEEA